MGWNSHQRDAKRWAAAACAVLFLAATGCYSMRPSSGGGQTDFSPPRRFDPQDVALPAGYQIEVIASGLTFPTGACFDDQNRLHVVEAGYSYGEMWTVPRLLRIEPDGGMTPIFNGGDNGPWTGVTWHEGAFFIAEGGVLEGGRILRVNPEGEVEVLVDGLPSHGDHHTDGPVAGPDGWIYFGQGTASNSGVIGKDNKAFGWLERFPNFHDIPGEDIVLAGRNFETPDVLGEDGGRVKTGAFLPFGTPSRPGQVIPGALKCSGAVFRVRPDGSDLERVAWGFRNPFGLGFSPEGTLFVTENSYDDRGSRAVWGTADVLWEVQPGLWHGWPDFSAGIALTNGMFKPPGKEQPRFLLAVHPNPPPKPVVKFAVHSSANGFNFSRNPDFGYEGNAFVALLGDQAPVVGKVLHPAGFKVARVDVEKGLVHDFAVNKGEQNAPASKLGTGGLERPVSVRFDREGTALYVVDFGLLLQRPGKTIPVPGTGAVWKITRIGGDQR